MYVLPDERGSLVGVLVHEALDFRSHLENNNNKQSHDGSSRSSGKLSAGESSAEEVGCAW